MYINRLKKSIIIRYLKYVLISFCQENLRLTAIWPESWHIYCSIRNKSFTFFFPRLKDVFEMELLHDSDELVGSLDCQLKRLEEKIDTSRPVA
jgi:hypothetical protein